MSDNKPLPRLTAARIIFVRELMNGPKKWGQLALAYYGESRYKGNKATTSFFNKVSECIELGIIKKAPEGYALGSVGEQLLVTIQQQNISMDVKSEAQLKWEAEHPVTAEVKS